METEGGLDSEKQYIARKISREVSGSKVVLVNICDEELLGTTVKTDQVDMPISQEYFGSDKVNEFEALNLVKNSGVVTLVGGRIVSKVVEANLASKRAVKEFGNVAFLMIYKF